MNRYPEKIATFFGTYLAHKGNKQNVRTPEETALRESNDETYQDMIPYVDKHHDNLNVSKTHYGQIHFAALNHKGKTIGVRILDPKYNNEGNRIGNHRDTMVIHPKFRKEYGHLHLKDGKVIEKDPEFLLIGHETMNKYLTKISSDLSIAEKSKGEEDQAITDYTKRLTKVTDPKLKEAIEHALKEERNHSKDLGEAIKELS